MKNQSPYLWRKSTPEELSIPIMKALQHYPELQAKKIVFKYTRKQGTSIMKAQPIIKSILRVGDDREYVIFVNRTLSLGKTTSEISEIPESILVGWFGHELGHVMDYESRSKWGLIRFGLGYFFSAKYIRKAEQKADEIAVRHGLGEEILQTKNFILNHADLSEKYKRKIRKLYLSPEQLMEFIKGEKELNELTC